MYGSKLGLQRLQGAADPSQDGPLQLRVVQVVVPCTVDGGGSVDGTQRAAAALGGSSEGGGWAGEELVHLHEKHLDRAAAGMALV